MGRLSRRQSTVVEFIGDQMEPVYLDDSILEEPVEDETGDDRQSDDDPMYEEAVRVVARDGERVRAIFRDGFWDTIERLES